MTEMVVTYWMQAGFGVVCTALAAAFRWLTIDARRRRTEAALQRRALMTLLHDRLYQACIRAIAAGEITGSELSNLGELYQAYHALGGNGTGTELYGRAKALPMRDNKEEQ